MSGFIQQVDLHFVQAGCGKVERIEGGRMYLEKNLLEEGIRLFSLFNKYRNIHKKRESQLFRDSFYKILSK